MTDSGSLEGEEAVLPDDLIERILLFREQLMKAEKTLTILRQEKESAIESFVQKEHLDSVDVNVFRVSPALQYYNFSASPSEKNGWSGQWDRELEEV